VGEMGATTGFIPGETTLSKPQKQLYLCYMRHLEQLPYPECDELSYEEWFDKFKKTSVLAAFFVLPNEDELVEDDPAVEGLRWCECGEHYADEDDFWDEDFADCKNCCTEKEYIEQTEE